MLVEAPAQSGSLDPNPTNDFGDHGPDLGRSSDSTGASWDHAAVAMKCARTGDLEADEIMSVQLVTLRTLNK